MDLISMGVFCHCSPASNAHPLPAFSALRRARQATLHAPRQCSLCSVDCAHGECPQDVVEGERIRPGCLVPRPLRPECLVPRPLSCSCAGRSGVGWGWRCRSRLLALSPPHAPHPSDPGLVIDSAVTHLRGRHFPSPCSHLCKWYRG